MPARSGGSQPTVTWRCRRVPDGRQKAQKFEDEYLDDLFLYVKELGFEALSYMPSRNTMEQLARVMDKCRSLISLRFPEKISISRARALFA